MELHGVLIVQDDNVTPVVLAGTAVVVIIKPKCASSVGFHGEVASGNAEVVVARGVYIEGSAPLPKNKARRQRGIMAGKDIELQARVFLQECRGPVLDFHFRAAIVRGQHISLSVREIPPRSRPRRG